MTINQKNTRIPVLPIQLNKNEYKPIYHAGSLNYGSINITNIEEQKNAYHNLKVERILKNQGIKPKRITVHDIDFSKDVAIILIILGMIISRKYEEDLDSTIEVIDNFHYKIELEKVITSMSKKREELLKLFDNRESRLIKIFKESIFKIYVHEFDSFTENEDFKTINIELLAILLFESRFKNTDLRPCRIKAFSKNQGIKPKRIIQRKLYNFLSDINFKTLSELTNVFSNSSTFEYKIANAITNKVKKINTKIKKI